MTGVELKERGNMHRKAQAKPRKDGLSEATFQKAASVSELQPGEILGISRKRAEYCFESIVSEDVTNSLRSAPNSVSFAKNSVSAL